MAQRRFYNDLRLLQKRANQAMVRLERLDFESPAYRVVQAQLEILGKQAVGNRGRRFSETGKATYNEYEAQKKILEEFLNLKTRTISGAKDWLSNVWESASQNEDLKLKETGVTRDQWLEFWENMPSKHQDRILDSNEYVKILRTYTYKNRKKTDEQKMSAREIAEAIQEQGSIKAAREALGLTYKDISKVNKLGAIE